MATLTCPRCQRETPSRIVEFTEDDRRASIKRVKRTMGYCQHCKKVLLVDDGRVIAVPNEAKISG